MTVQVIAPNTKTAGPIPDPLEKPGIRQSLDQINLDPMEVYKAGRLTAAIVRLSQRLLETDTFSVKATGDSADNCGSYESPELPLGSPNVRTLNLDVAVLAYNLNKKIKFEYTVKRAGETPVTSDELELNVGDIAPKDLKAGVIVGEDGDGTDPVLDLTTAPSDRTARVDSWPLIAVGQWLWIVLKGEDENGNPYELTLFEGQVDQDLITLGYIKLPALFSWLKELANESILTFTYKVAFDQVKDESKANLSEVRSYSVKNHIAGQPWIRHARDVDGNDIRYASYTASTSVEVSGTASPHQVVNISDNRGFMGTATADDKGEWKKQLTGLNEGLYIIKVAGSINPHDRRFIVVDPRFTIITVARDSLGNVIPWNSVTYDRSIVLAGTGDPGEEIRIESRTVLQGKTRVKPDGRWELALSELTDNHPVFYAYGAYSGGLVPHGYQFRIF